MKNINLIKMSLDITMVVVFALLFNKMAVAGLHFHEIAGLAIGFAFIIHKLLNWKWIKQVTSNLFGSKVAIKTQIGYMVDVLLLLCMTMIIGSGIPISKVLFANLGVERILNFKAIHISAAYIALLLIGIHVGLHWNWVMNIFKRIFKVPQKRRILNYAAKLAVILVLLFGSYNIYSVDYFSKASMIVDGFVQKQGPMPGGGIGKMPPGAKDTMPPAKDGISGGQQIDGRNGSGAKSPDAQEGPEKFPPDRKSFPQTNALTILSTFLSIIAAFSIFTFYMEKVLTRKRMNALPG